MAARPPGRPAARPPGRPAARLLVVTALPLAPASFFTADPAVTRDIARPQLSATAEARCDVADGDHRDLPPR
ncbi:hypothetical protein ABZZ20_00810 [Streptomyces sp. NPDC006430]|uniref:hypothetical protein n=1 Tax=Streptomyces sp. NPDC006430 TaxID=3154299 RepID=UPI0033B9527C